MTPDGAPALSPHHSLAAHEVVLLLETDLRRGLDRSEATARLHRYGPNLLPTAETDGPLVRLLRQFNHPLIYVLLAAGTVTAVLNERVDAAVIFGVVVVNAAIGFLQESKAEAALDALRSMVRTQARVVRDGQTHTVPSDQLVPGDLVVLEPGDMVPADLRLVEEVELQADESALTGESQPVAKDEVVLPVTTPVSDRRNMVYSGTLVTSGAGTGIVVASGADTELGEIHRLVSTADALSTPLTRKLASFSKVLTVVILGLAAIAFAVGVARGEKPSAMFTAAVALAVGAIPEGLPAAVTITLAIGVARMARRRAVVRRLPAVETLGSTTVICTDKTGTLTRNEMTVRTVWTIDESYAVSGIGYEPHGEVTGTTGRPVSGDTHGALHQCLVAAASCNDAHLASTDGRWHIAGDPTEGALVVAALKAGLDPDRLATDLPRVATVPFSAERRYMATLHASDDGGGRDRRHVVFVKGAVEQVVEMCTLELARDGSTHPLDRHEVVQAEEALAGQGLRVLAVAVGHLDDPSSFEESSLAGTLTFAGLVAMQDPPRPAVADAIASCRSAGIAVKMITGDHVATATAIARDLGIVGDGADHLVMTGADLAALDPDELPGAVDRAVVFARVSPEQKLRLVESMQSRRHVVAMTGDGVNDAPALRQADIGVAMGTGGTEVAKDAADVVLTDDDFTTIEAAVEEGRGVFDNLVKFIVWTLPTNMGEGLVILVSIILGNALPVLPVQILWINMTTAVALGLTLAFEPKEAGIMDRPPRDPRRPLLTGDLVVRILLVASLLVAASWWLFEWERSHGASLATARTAAVNLFVAVEAVYLFSCRSFTRSAWRLGLGSNRWLLVGVSAQAAGQFALTYVPAMQRLFQTAPLDGGAWLRIALLAAGASVVVAADKRWHHWHH